MTNDETVDERARTVDERSRPAGTSDERSRAAGTVGERGSGALSTSGRGVKRRPPSVLPVILNKDYEAIAILARGGQASVVECRDRTTGETVVVKVYHHPGQLSRTVLDKLRGASDEHVVRLIKYGDADGELWEVQEYCAGGTLADLLGERDGPLTQPELTVVLRELAGAVRHIQEDLDITHRDLKPENVLVRTRQPLDLVLTDFGVAAEQMMTVQFQTRAGTNSWMAPETLAEQQVTKAVDWWALGAIMYRALTGRMLLSSPAGRSQESKVHDALVVRGEYTTDAIQDPRWRNLVDGLLSYDTADRWGYAQVESWLAGGNPKAVRTVPRGAATAPKEPDFAFVLDGLPVRTGKEMADAVRERWEAAGDLIAGRIDPQLERWITARSGGKAVIDSIGTEITPGARLIRLQAELDPDGPLVFRGREIDDDTLSASIAEAAMWSPGTTGRVAESHAWLSALRSERILRAVAAVVPAETGRGLGTADARVDAWTRQFRAVRAKVPKDGHPELNQLDQVEARLLPRWFSIVFSEGSASDQGAEARGALRDGDVGEHRWAAEVRDLASQASDDDLGTLQAAHAVVLPVMQSVRDEKARIAAEKAVRERRALEAANRAEQERQRKEEERRSAQRRARRQANTRDTPARLFSRALPAGAYSLVCGLLLNDGAWEGMLALAWPVFLACLVPIVMSVALDWVIGDPEGALRRLGVTLGVMLGIAPWIAVIAIAVPTDASRFPAVDMTLLPWAVGVGWMVGGVAQYGLNRAFATGRGWGSSPGPLIRWSTGLVTITLILAGASTATWWFLVSCGSACSMSAVSLWAGSSLFTGWQTDPMALLSGDGLVWVMILAWGAYVVAHASWQRTRVLSIGALMVSGLLGLAVLRAYPVSPLTVLLGLIVGWLS